MAQALVLVATASIITSMSYTLLIRDARELVLAFRHWIW